MKNNENLTILKINLNGECIFAMADRRMTDEEVRIFQKQLLHSEQVQTSIVSHRSDFPLWDFEDNGRMFDRAAAKMRVSGITLQLILPPVEVVLDAKE